MNLQFLPGVWAAIFLAYATVSLMRWNVARREDDHIHVADHDQHLISTQSSLAHKLDVLDRWKTALLILTILSALAIGGLHVYHYWMETSSTPYFS